MSIKAFALAALAAAGIALAGTPASADGLSFSFGFHGGHFGHKHGFHRKHKFHRKHRFHRRHFRRHHFHGHFQSFWWPYYPKRRTYVPHHYYAPRYAPPAYSTVTPPPTVTGTGYCREYTREVIVDGRPARAYGQACRQPDGSWRIVSER